MCRWIAWSGAPKFLEELICAPEHSLIHQSRNAFFCKTQVNADGFGIAWYGNRQEPCIYKDVRPAWADSNLTQLAHHVSSPLFLAHIRASTGTSTNHDNCHPFSYRRWSFMHNGQVGGYENVRKKMDTMIPDHLYRHRKGATDSEALFLIALGYGLEQDPVGAMVRTVEEIEAMARAEGGLPHMRLSAAWSDGTRIFAARYASDEQAPSLYYRTFADGTLIVSEPLDEAAGCWVEVPSSTIVMVADGRVHQYPFQRQIAAE
ncbi:class II glutamine amidotransferase [Roseibium sp.]|uniref:class II glutamine amidotransferase n=1 Tax=Roseibium sp. TaxID=1936156 RepID=UPI003A97C3BB